MLNIHAAGKSAPLQWHAGDTIPADAVWLDLRDADGAEIAACEVFARVRLPTRTEIAGIGVAGRNRYTREAIFLQVARFSEAGASERPTSPVSIVLTPRLLVTQREGHSRSFDTALHDWHAAGTSADPATAFAELLESMAEGTATGMQKIAADVAELSGKVFDDNRVATRQLRRRLIFVGKLEARLARSRAALLGISRIVAFLCERAPEWVASEPRERIDMVRNDLAALDQFDEQLTGKLQFLLDAILGLISVNQNNVMKVFTVVSVVAVPPVLLAGIWGMNFKAMPELAQPWGYAMALSAIAVSILVPLAIFKWRGWLSND